MKMACDNLLNFLFRLLTCYPFLLDVLCAKRLISSCVLTGLELLLGLLGSTNTKQQLDGAAALYRLANKSMALSPVDAAPPSPTQRVSFPSCFSSPVYKLWKFHLQCSCFVMTGLSRRAICK